MEDLTGKQLGPYQIVAQLGVGGMATVFKAYQPKMDRYVALKILPRFFSKNPEFVSRFSQEARLIAQLEHLHILPVYDFGESDGYTYLAMRLVKGGSLSNLLKKHGKLELTKINRIVTQVGGALDYAHKKDVIHRDTKPGNVLIDEFGNCLLADFGIAKLIETTSNLTHTGGILGTPSYISPEQGSGKPIDRRSDIYSFGVMLYHMIVGDVPYKADTPMAVVYKHIHDPLPLPRKQVPELPESVERVVLKALAKNPDDRYSTVAELVKDLQRAIDQFDVQIKEVRESDPDFETTEVAREIPADEKELPTEPPVESKPGIIKPKEIEEKKTLPGTVRVWTYSVLAIILLAMFAGTGWYYYNNIFLSEPILSVESNPSGADVYVNGGHVGVSPVKVEGLVPGSHKIQVSKDHYQDYNEDLFIKKGKPKVVQADLTPKPFGDLKVNSNPSGAEVYIDDDKRGITPIALENLPKGTRKVMIKKEGFDTWLDTVEIMPLEKAHMSADLVSIFGGLNISSNPSEADVYIGGKKKGKTPFILKKVKKGQQKIEIKKTGFDVWRGDVTVKLSEVAKVHVDLRAVISSPKVKSAPSSAIISLVDKKKLGLEHQRLENEKRLLEEKKHLEAEKKGLEQERQKLEKIRAEIKERKGLEAEKQLLEEKTPPKSSLYVDTDPKGAKIKILNIGEKFYQGIELKSGRYHMEVSANGYETQKMWVSLAVGEDKTLNIRLKGKKITNSLGMEFVYIEPGTFLMGSPFNESGREDDEKQHRVTLTKGFYMQTTEVTQGQWKAVMGNNPSYFKNCGDDCPVERVAWNYVHQFISKLNQREGSGKYRLPTEAEWEYAPRAGSTTAFANGDITETSCGYDTNLNAMGWYCGNSNKKTHLVAQKQVNAWGLYDMHGNVWEWCQDLYGNYPSDPVTNPTGLVAPNVYYGSGHVARGGSWLNSARCSRSAYRVNMALSINDQIRGDRLEHRSNNIGFRLLMNP